MINCSPSSGLLNLVWDSGECQILCCKKIGNLPNLPDQTKETRLCHLGTADMTALKSPSPGCLGGVGSSSSGTCQADPLGRRSSELLGT